MSSIRTFTVSVAQKRTKLSDLAHNERPIVKGGDDAKEVEG